MVQVVGGKTMCALCEAQIDTLDNTVGFPAFVPKGHVFSRFSDATFHRQCFLDWENHDQFLSLYEKYKRVWKSRPAGMSYEEAEEWGKHAFEHIFENGMLEPE